MSVEKGKLYIHIYVFVLKWISLEIRKFSNVFEQILKSWSRFAFLSNSVCQQNFFYRLANNKIWKWKFLKNFVIFAMYSDSRWKTLGLNSKGVVRLNLVWSRYKFNRNDRLCHGTGTGTATGILYFLIKMLTFKTTKIRKSFVCSFSFIIWSFFLIEYAQATGNRQRPPCGEWQNCTIGNKYHTNNLLNVVHSVRTKLNR